MSPNVLYPFGNTWYDFQHHNTIPNDLLLEHPYNTKNSYCQPQYWPAPYFSQGEHYYHNPRTMAELDPHEMDDFQRLSNNYTADLPGPLISDKLPLTVLTTEFAQADPTFVTKTTALAKTYSAYRTIKGDGQCGWRAPIFGYFEKLLQRGDLEQVEQERVRLQTFETTMTQADIDLEMLLPMFEYTWELFDRVQSAVERNDKNDAIILEYLNDEIRSNSILYHFKMMTSSYMQLHAEDFEPFLEMQIAEYRASRIDPINQEIDQIGLQALTDAVIAPANIALEVLYLDRSVGEEVTPHQFAAEHAGKPTIRLLYRPGHYDMLYKDDRRFEGSLQQDSTLTQAVNVTGPSDVPTKSDTLSFPGTSASQSVSQGQIHYSTNQGASTHKTNQYKHTFPVYIPALCDMTPAPWDLLNQPASWLNMDFSGTFLMQFTSSGSGDMSSPTHATKSLPLPPAQPPMPLSTKSVNEPQIRLNANCFNYSEKHESVPLCTQTCGSAAATSPAHFLNRDFQPQIWRAEEEYLKL